MVDGILKPQRGQVRQGWVHNAHPDLARYHPKMGTNAVSIHTQSKFLLKGMQIIYFIQGLLKLLNNQNPYGYISEKATHNPSRSSQVSFIQCFFL